MRRRPKSATFDRKGELKPPPGPLGPVQLSEEANAYVNFNMRQQNRPKSAHASTTRRSQMPSYPKSFPLPHMNYPEPPDNGPSLLFPAPGAIRAAINKNRVSGLSAVRPISAPANRLPPDGNVKAPPSNAPSARRPKSARRSVAERFKEELAMSRLEDAYPLAAALGQHNDRAGAHAEMAPTSSSIKKLPAAATIATAAARKIFGGSVQKQNKTVNDVGVFSSADPKDRIMKSNDDKGRRIFPK